MPIGSILFFSLRRTGLALLVALVAFVSVGFTAQGLGRITGVLTRSDGSPMAGVVVAPSGPGAQDGPLTFSDEFGAYELTDLGPGMYSLTFTLGGNLETETGIGVTPGATTTVDKTLDWNLFSIESLSVVVTARKRGELSQDIPMFITTVGESEIRETAISNLADLSTTVPNLMIGEAGVSTNLFVRGIGSGVNQGFEQSVGTFVDGIYMGRGFQARAPFLDVDLVEILKRPQGVLFGKNTIAGALNIRTAEPTDTFEGYATAMYEPVHGEQVVTAVVSGPLSRTLAVRHSGLDGYLNNTSTGRDNPQKGESVVRGSLGWKPSEEWNILAKIETGSFDVDGRQSDISNPGGFLKVFKSGDSNETGIFDQDRSIGGTGLFADEFNHADNTNVSLRVDKDFGEYTFTSISGYSAYDYTEIVDADVSALSVLQQFTDQDFGQWSQEVRLVSPLGRKFEYMAGAYFQDNRIDSRVRLDLDLAEVGTPAAGSRDNTFVQDSRTLSTFGQGSWRLRDDLILTGGLRFTNENKDVLKRQVIADIGTDVPNPGLEPFFRVALGSLPHTLVRSRSESNVSSEAGLEFDASEGILLYGSIAQGFKGGGFDEVNVSGNPDTFEFEEESVLAFEAGAKTTFPNPGVVLNAAVFVSKFKDLQVSAFDGVTAFTVGNAAEATSQGFEVDAEWFPSSSLTLNSAFALLDAHYDAFPDAQCTSQQTATFSGSGSCTQDLAGRETQFAPTWRGSTEVEHSMSLGNEWDLTSRLALNYTGRYALANDLDANLFQEAFAKIDLRVSLGNPGRNWSVALLGKNLTNRLTSTWGNDIPLFPGAYFRFADRGRSLAIQAQWIF
jgi:outer membrane receptor protein involved in Fe transport